ncbi:MAG: phosphatidylinositol mannoside acyltransferase [Mycobacteriales bacterium]
MTGKLRYLPYAAGWAIVRALPERAGAALFRAGADLAVRRRGPGVERLESNLRRVLGPGVTEDDVTRTLRAALRSYARYWLEVFRLPAMRPARIERDMQLANFDRLQSAAAAGRGVICVLPHQGNWDVAGAWFIRVGYPFTTVAERLQPKELFDRFLAFRESIGMEVLPTRGGERPPFAVLEERLRAGGILCLLADRDLTERGIEVSFFGDTTRFPAGPAMLAVRTGAVLLPVNLWFRDEGWGGVFHEPVTPPTRGTDRERIAAMTQSVATAFESGIRAHPEDWHMLQRLWLADLAVDDPRRARHDTDDVPRAS